MKLLLSSLVILIMLHVTFSAPSMGGTQQMLNQLNGKQEDELVQIQHAFKMLINQLHKMDADTVHKSVATVQEDLNAAIEGWWETLSDWATNVYDGVMTVCSYIPLNNKAETQWIANIGTGLAATRKVCDYINGRQATIERLLGFSLEDLKNKGKQLLSNTTAGCEKYNDYSDLERELTGDKTMYLDLVCQGLTGNEPAVVQVLFDNTVHSVLEDKKAKEV